MTSKTITFTQDASIVNEGRVPRLYKAGETHTLRLDQAQRWIKRGVAVVADTVATARAEMDALKRNLETPKIEPVPPAAAEAYEGSFDMVGENLRPDAPATDGVQPDVLKDEAADGTAKLLDVVEKLGGNDPAANKLYSRNQRKG